MQRRNSNVENIYQIKVKESLDQRVTEWFGDLTVTTLQSGETLLTGPVVDQGALRGLLEYLWNLNITVVSVEKMDTQPLSESGEYHANA